MDVKQHSTIVTEHKSSVTVEVAVLGSTVPNSSYVFCVRTATPVEVELTENRFYFCPGLCSAHLLQSTLTRHDLLQRVTTQSKDHSTQNPPGPKDEHKTHQDRRMNTKPTRTEG